MVNVVIVDVKAPVNIPTKTKPIKVHIIATILPGTLRGEMSPYLKYTGYNMKAE